MWDDADRIPPSASGVRKRLKPMRREYSIMSARLALADALRAALRAMAVGDRVHLSLLRGKESKDILATLVPVSRPLSLAAQRATLGVRAADPLDEDGARITQVETDSPGSKAGLQTGD